MSLLNHGFTITPSKNKDKKDENLTPAKRPVEKSAQKSRKKKPKEPKIEKEGNIREELEEKENKKHVKSPGVLSFGEHVHNTYPWAKTKPLRVPNSFLVGKTNGKKNCTDNMKTWWKFKQKYPDCILFFKVGKFYEIYHMDADVAVAQTELTYMKGELAHCGFPELAFGKFCNLLVDKGFSVARVEQTETPEMMKKRTGKSSGCVKRKLCGIVSPGTRTFDYRTRISEKQTPGKTNLLGIYSQGKTGCKFGFAFIDCATAKIYFGQVEDEKNLSQLRTVLVRQNPAEIVYMKDNVEKNAMKVLYHLCPEEETKYVPLESSDLIEGNIFEHERFIDVRPTGRAAKVALKLCFTLLQRNLVLDEILNVAQIQELGIEISAKKGNEEQRNMTIDAVSLENLHILPIKAEQSSLTLFSYLNRCGTKFGARQIKEWITKPLMQVAKIEHRNRIVWFLKRIYSEVDSRTALSDFKTSVKKMKDVERLLVRLESLGLRKDPHHPDTEAILYEVKKLNRKKIEMLVDTLQGLRVFAREISVLIDSLANQTFPEEKTDNIFAKGKEKFVELLGLAKVTEVLEELKLFKNTFDLDEAREEGAIVPHKGVVESFDKAQECLLEVEDALNIELKRARKHFPRAKPSDIKFKTGFQIEVKNEVLGKTSAPTGWILSSKTKTVRRFVTQEITKLIEKHNGRKLVVEREKRDVMRGVFSRFSSMSSLWTNIVHVVRDIDCYISLASVCAEETGELNWCCPKFSESEESKLCLSKNWHPLVAQSLESVGKDYITNDVKLSSGNKNDGLGRVMLLTGANMAGKSSILRQMCISVILAQIGCLVPAQQCEMTVVDRVFTRIGASDKIIQGESTFYVELFETSSILKSATKCSLVVFDELGRGTSTYDGAAIAFGVIKEILKRSCLAVFATHYHQLVEELEHTKHVKVKHMAVSNCENGQVAFLYKLSEGASGKSYGINVAKLAGLDNDIVQVATEQSELASYEVMLKRIESDWRKGVLSKEVSLSKLTLLSKTLKNLNLNSQYIP
eukprot:augustus_masked-scaffold_15-processed-gene-0.44-mRNA-1 protein AED:0.36 eAED:0.36 QI:0/-1/0/1/-1/1/1/0/1026